MRAVLSGFLSKRTTGLPQSTPRKQTNTQAVTPTHHDGERLVHDGSESACKNASSARAVQRISWFSFLPLFFSLFFIIIVARGCP